MLEITCETDLNHVDWAAAYSPDFGNLLLHSSILLLFTQETQPLVYQDYSQITRCHSPAMTPRSKESGLPAASVNGTCKELKESGVGSDFTSGDANYTSARDRDNDGVACES